MKKIKAKTSEMSVMEGQVGKIVIFIKVYTILRWHVLISQ